MILPHPGPQTPKRRPVTRAPFGSSGCASYGVVRVDQAIDGGVSTVSMR